MPSYPCGNGPHHSFTPPEQPETDPYNDMHGEELADPWPYFCLNCQQPIEPRPTFPLKGRLWWWWHILPDMINYYGLDCPRRKTQAHHLEFPADAAQKLGLADDTFLYIDPTGR